MIAVTNASPAVRRPLRLWPGVLLVVVQWLGRYLVPMIHEEWLPYAVMGGLLLSVLVVVWWIFFSRAPWQERVAAIAVMALALVLVPRVLHDSIAGGMMGMMFYVYALPLLSLALVVWAVAARRLTGAPRWATLVAAILLSTGSLALVRTAGMTGSADSDFAWRWSPTAEDLLLQQAETLPPAAEAAPATASTDAAAEWPGFRGPGRDGVAAGSHIDTDWATSPPRELWRRPVGPGWSSFAVRGDHIFTQEQRGDDEAVSCYDADTGEPVWRHTDPVRFWESNGGAGPRGTPTLDGGELFAFGATGILNALDATDGSVLWSRDVAADTGKKVPGWGFSASPLVQDDLVVIAAAGRLAAYDRVVGELRWSGPDGGGGYSSPHRLTLDGVEQIVLMSSIGATSVSPTDGTVLWQHEMIATSRIVEPAQTADGDLLLSDGEGHGMRRLAVEQGAAGWTTSEVWASQRLKPYFNDFVVHEGHAYGFDGSILACIDVATGERQWKGGRYGGGQMVLLPEQDLLLVVSEQGELALVGATPGGFAELSRVPAIEGKTWNHPVLVDDLLLVRNDREMAAFRLAGVGRAVARR